MGAGALWRVHWGITVEQWDMGGFAKTFDALNRSGLDFLLTDIDVGMTFMDIAEASHIQETVSRNHNNAHKAYDAVVHLLKKLKPDAEQRQTIETKLAVLKTRLEAVGHQF